MTEKDKFLNLRSYEEFNRRREEFYALEFDKEIAAHMSKIFSKPSGINEELLRCPAVKAEVLAFGNIYVLDLESEEKL